MKKDLTFNESKQEQFSNALEAILRQGAQRLLQQAIEAEVADYMRYNRKLCLR